MTRSAACLRLAEDNLSVLCCAMQCYAVLFFTLLVRYCAVWCFTLLSSALFKLGCVAAASYSYHAAICMFPICGLLAILVALSYMRCHAHVAAQDSMPNTVCRQFLQCVRSSCGLRHTSLL